MGRCLAVVAACAFPESLARLSWQPTTLKQVRALQAAYEWASTNNDGKSMMQLEEITPPDPRLAGWNDDDAPVAMRCLACAVEPKQASSLIRELHDALPASSGGVAHVKRVKKLSLIHISEPTRPY